MPARRPAVERFWEKVDRSPEGCWLWLGATNRGGYGVFGTGVGKQTALAHRFSYESVHGPLPDGASLDHLCRRRACVNPAHLEPVTLRENVLRGQAPNIVVHRTKVCRRGHALTDDNLYSAPSWKGLRHTCKICLKLRNDQQPRVGQGHANTRKTACPRGHPYSSENTYLNNGRRNCITCRRDSAQRRSAQGSASMHQDNVKVT